MSLTSSSEHDLILTGLLREMGDQELAGICVVREHSCIKLFKTCYCERKT